MPSEVRESDPGEDRPVRVPGLTTPEPSSSASSDDLTASLSHARPDPMLGEYVTPPPPGPDAEWSAPFGDGPTAPAPPLTEAKGLSVTSADAISGLDLSTTTPPDSPTSRREDEDVEEGEEDDGPAERGTSLGMILLASYASAVTLGLIWVLWTGRRVREKAEVEPGTALTAAPLPDPGRRAGQSRKVGTAPPITADHTARLGQTVRLGKIEARPLEVTSGGVELVREFAGRQTRTAGEQALKLRLRLRNVSGDTVLAPLDEAFVRQRERDDPDSYIETEPGARSSAIPMFPLAVESEWAIIGQTFRELKPGEEFEALLVSAPEATARATREMTWRVRLRTDINHTDDLGVRFGKDEIKPGR